MAWAGRIRRSRAVRPTYPGHPLEADMGTPRVYEFPLALARSEPDRLTKRLTFSARSGTVAREVSDTHEGSEMGNEAEAALHTVWGVLRGPGYVVERIKEALDRAGEERRASTLGNGEEESALLADLRGRVESLGALVDHLQDEMQRLAHLTEAGPAIRAHEGARIVAVPDRDSTLCNPEEGPERAELDSAAHDVAQAHDVLLDAEMRLEQAKEACLPDGPGPRARDDQWVPISEGAHFQAGLRAALAAEDAGPGHVAAVPLVVAQNPDRFAAWVDGYHEGLRQRREKADAQGDRIVVAAERERVARASEERELEGLRNIAEQQMPTRPAQPMTDAVAAAADCEHTGCRRRAYAVVTTGTGEWKVCVDHYEQSLAAQAIRVGHEPAWRVPLGPDVVLERRRGGPIGVVVDGELRNYISAGELAKVFEGPVE
jgi:hypothetical protein